MTSVALTTTAETHPSPKLIFARPVLRRQPAIIEPNDHSHDLPSFWRTGSTNRDEGRVLGEVYCRAIERSLRLMLRHQLLRIVDLRRQRRCKGPRQNGSSCKTDQGAAGDAASKVSGVRTCPLPANPCRQGDTRRQTILAARRKLNLSLTEDDLSPVRELRHIDDRPAMGQGGQFESPFLAGLSRETPVSFGPSRQADFARSHLQTLNIRQPARLAEDRIGRKQASQAGIELRFYLII